MMRDSGQGYKGGDGAPTSNNYRGTGGGGGAGAAGGNGNDNSSNSGGTGGVGSSAYSSWGSVTSSGQNVGGTYYYAVGGAVSVRVTIIDLKP